MGEKKEIGWKPTLKTTGIKLWKESWGKQLPGHRREKQNWERRTTVKKNEKL